MLGRDCSSTARRVEREVGRGQKIHGHLTKNLAARCSLFAILAARVMDFQFQNTTYTTRANKMAARHLCLIIKSNLWRLLTNRRNAKLGIFGFQIQRFVEIAVDLCILYFLRKSIYLNSPRMYYMQLIIFDLGLALVIILQTYIYSTLDPEDTFDVNYLGIL